MTITPPEPASEPAASEPAASEPAASEPAAVAPAAFEPAASAQPVPQALVPQNPYAPQYTYVNQVPYAPAPPRGLSITAMILGILGIVGSFMGGFLLSIGAVIFGHIGLRKEPAGRGMAIAGLVTGYIGVGLGVVFVVGLALWIITTLTIAGVAVGTSGLNS